jgi:RNA polymerase II subunit A small phosphatase-like protein
MEPKSNNLIIFDLDETLIHSTVVELNDPCHFRFDTYYVYERPFLRSFLDDIAKHFQIGIWSSAGDQYVQEIAGNIIPDTVDPVIIWGRSKCSLRRDAIYDTSSYEKRLDKLKKKGFPIEKILIIDDSPEKARTNYGNAIYIKEFTGNPDDSELRSLYTYLLTFKMVDNVRTIEKRGWRHAK